MTTASAKSVVRALLVTALTFALTFAAHPARACANAVFQDDSRTKLARTATDALAVGDVLTAREAADALAARADSSSMSGDSYGDRARWLRAMSFVRDADATPIELQGAVKTLGSVRDSRSRNGASRDMALESDYGEALARVGENDTAYAVLHPLVDRDLVGDPWAYAAFARVARERGDAAAAGDALAQCMRISGGSLICSGAYPSKPLLRGPTWRFVVCGLLALVAFVARARERWKPWRGYRAPFHTALLALATFGVLTATLRSVLACVAFALALLLVGLDERYGFLRAARAGKLPGLVLRPAEDPDAVAPVALLLFGPTHPETLERIRDEATYRANARSPELVIARRPPRTYAVAIALCLAIAVAGGFASLLTLARG